MPLEQLRWSSGNGVSAVVQGNQLQLEAQTQRAGDIGQHIKLQCSAGVGLQPGVASDILHMAGVAELPADGLVGTGGFQGRSIAEGGVTPRRIVTCKRVFARTAALGCQLIKAAQHLDGANGSADAVVACKPGVARKHNHAQGGHGKNSAVDNLPAGSLNKRLGVLLGI